MAPRKRQEATDDVLKGSCIEWYGLVASLTVMTRDRLLLIQILYTDGVILKHSSIFNSISLASGDGTVGGDDSDLVHYSTKFILLGLKVLSAGGGLPGRAPIIRRRRTRTGHFGHWDQPPHLIGKRLRFRPEPHLNVEVVQSQFLSNQ